MIKREKYIAPIRSFYDSDLIKIITGVRRCGKSEILKQIKTEIAEKSDNIIYLNFEDRIVTEQIQEWKDIVTYIEDNKKNGFCYVFLVCRIGLSKCIGVFLFCVSSFTKINV